MTHHQHLAKLWCQWNGQRGTDKQIAKVMHLTVEDLTRMLTERGVVIAG
jgi:hypothetical protein